MNNAKFTFSAYILDFAYQKAHGFLQVLIIKQSPYTSLITICVDSGIGEMEVSLNNRLDIYVCVGSSCHLKGSYQIINCFQRLIKDNHLETQAELKASFCMGQCTTGVCVKVGDDFYGDVGIINAESFFTEKVINKLSKK